MSGKKIVAPEINTYKITDLDILESNYFEIKRLAGGAQVICVIKDNAYGHGSVRCAKILYSAGCRLFAVANLTEADEVMPFIPDAKVLILGYSDPKAAAARKNIIQAVFSSEYAERLSAAAKQAESDVECHLKLDTGMNRIGFSTDDDGIASAVAARKLSHLHFTGVFTHFCCSDNEESKKSEEQLRLYRYAVEEIERRSGAFSLHHICNSAGILRFSSCESGAVRAGIILYGLHPSDTVYSSKVKPVMELISRVTHIHTASRGETVGYGATFTAVRDTRIATVAAGYGNGFLRAYGKNGLVEFPELGSCSAPIIGRICMDQFMVDVTDLPDVKIDSEVRLFGRCAITADDIAQRAGTIGYEVTCNVRYPAFYVEKGELTADAE